MKLTRKSLRRLILKEMMHPVPDYDTGPTPMETDSDDDIFQYDFDRHGDEMIFNAIENGDLDYDPINQVVSSDGIQLATGDFATGYQVNNQNDYMLYDILKRDYSRGMYSLDDYDANVLDTIQGDAYDEALYSSQNLGYDDY